jgi:cell division protein FtsI/penicillin-binding protein 2
MKLELQKGSRSQILAAFLFIIFVVIIGRLFYLQIIQHDYYVGLASDEQVTRLTIPAQRGLIYALDGDKPVGLVMNETVYTLFADPVITDDNDKIVDVVKRIAGGNARANIADLLKLTDTRYQILATKLTRTQADKIKAENLHGIGFQAESQRVYPEGSLAAQVLGFVDASGTGRYGLESGIDSRLQGKDGLLKTVVDVNDVPLTIGNQNVNKPAVNGESVVLSIDRNIQAYAEQALADGLKRTGATNGSALVIDPQTGKVMAMANLPTYKPAEFNKVDDAAVFNNDTISAPYEPGSDIKTFTMATGIDKNVAKASDTYNNTDYIKVEDRTISNATKGHTGEITLQTALNWSLNTGFVTVAERLGDGTSITKGARDTMYDYFYNKFKLGQLTGVELANEATGEIVSPDEQEGNAVRYSNMAFGQGMNATMLQVASAFSSIINGGNYYKPTVIAGKVDTTGEYVANAVPAPTSRTVAQSTSDQIHQMIHDARATFYTSVDKPGYDIGGKTGTSETLVNGQYTDHQTIGTYLGYGGGNSPKYVIMVELSGKDEALQGARDALPIFTDISNWLIDYLKIQPKG